MPNYTWYAIQLDNANGELTEHAVFHQHETEAEATDMLGGFEFPGFLCRENSRGDRRYDYGGGLAQTAEEAVAMCVASNELDPEMPPGAVVPEDEVKPSGTSAALAVLNAPEAGDEDAADILQAVADTLGFHMDDMDPDVLNAEILAEVRKIVAVTKAVGSRSAAKIDALDDKERAALDKIAEATLAKVDGGRRDWEALGHAVWTFDGIREESPTVFWECPVDVWNALTGYQRFLCMTGHNKTGWGHGGPRTIYGVKCPSHTGSGYDKQRDRLKTALEALGLTCAETIKNANGDTVMLKINVD